MRKERTERAKTTTKASTSATGSPAGQMILQGLEDVGRMEEDMGEMQLITHGAGKSNSGNTKNKKKRKRKNKK
jgi:hypothetical protein